MLHVALPASDCLLDLNASSQSWPCGYKHFNPSRGAGFPDTKITVHLTLSPYLRSGRPVYAAPGSRGAILYRQFFTSWTSVGNFFLGFSGLVFLLLEK